MDRLKRFYHALLAGMREAGLCFALGLRVSLSPGIFMRSTGWCVLVTCACLYLFYKNIAAISLLCVYVSLFAAMGVANFALLPANQALSGMAAAADPFALFNGVFGIVQLTLYMGAYFVVLMFMVLLAWVVVGLRLAVHLGFFAQVRARVARGYPAVCSTATQPGDTAWRAAGLNPAKWLGLSWWTLGSLLIPLYNGLLILLALPFLNMRLLLAPAIGGYAQGAEMLAIARRERVAIVFLGLLNLLLVCVPVLNLVLPATLCGSACHLYLRALERQRAQVQALPSAEAAGGMEAAPLA